MYSIFSDNLQFCQIIIYYVLGIKHSFRSKYNIRKKCFTHYFLNEVGKRKLVYKREFKNVNLLTERGYSIKDPYEVLLQKLLKNSKFIKTLKISYCLENTFSGSFI